jgi:hypothetical protein
MDSNAWESIWLYTIQKLEVYDVMYKLLIVA